MTDPAHNLKAAGSNPAPATNFAVLESGSLKNLKSSNDALAQLANVLLELGKRMVEVSALLNPSPALSPAHTTYKEFVDTLLVAKAVKGVRDRTLTQLRYSLSNFGEGRMHRPIDSFTAEEIETFIAGKDWGAATRRSFLTDLRTAFNFAVRRGLVKLSPANAVDMPLLDEDVFSLHSPDEARGVLSWCQANDKDLMRLLAVQYFGGLRPEAEAARLVEGKILPSLIDVTWSKIRRQRRLVTIEPVLSAWLGVGGSLPVINLKRRFERMREKCGVVWAQDVTRHSFATYHLALYQDARKTALEMGHRSTDMLFTKYREQRTASGQLVTPGLAREFWEIKPA